MSGLNISDYQALGQKVDPRLFGTNMLSHQNAPDAAFTNALNLIGANSLRFPGGTVTEKEFSIRDPNATVGLGGSSLVPLDRFMEYAHSNQLSATIVIPTRALLAGAPDDSGAITRGIDLAELAATRDFIKDLLLAERGRADATGFFSISAFEIGNEYWASGEMTASEYGLVVNEVSIILRELIDQIIGSDSAEIAILAQMGSPWDRKFDEGGMYKQVSAQTSEVELERLGLSQSDFGSDGELTWAAKLRLSNMDIISNLSPQAMSSITGVVEHYYYNKSRENLTNEASDRNYIDQDFRIWEAAGMGGLELHITEWNVAAQNVNELGLKSAGIIVHQFANMVRMGVDSASSWALQHNTPTSLAGAPGSEGRQTASSLVLAHLYQNSIGLELVELRGTQDEIETTLFLGTESAVLYVASRSSSHEMVSLALGNAFAASEVLSASLVVVDTSTSDSLHWINGRLVSVATYGEYDASARIESIDLATALHEGTLNLSLGPFEVAMIVLDRSTISGTENGDRIMGSWSDDVILGHEGNDTIFGSSGNDTLEGGLGIDTVVYRSGADMLVNLSSGVSQGVGNDRIMAIDHVLTGSGADRIVGDVNSNFLSSGGGDDTLTGMAGNDTIAPGRGNDMIFGGVGIDTAIFTTNASVQIDLVVNGTQRTGDGLDSLISIESIQTGSGSDIVLGSSLRNSVSCGPGNDMIDGRGGDDYLNGGSGSDSIYGRSGEDTLVGSEGRDFLFGGIGNDVFRGGLGRDQFIIAVGDGDDRISDFDVGVDSIVFSAVTDQHGISLTGSSAGSWVRGEGFSVFLRGVDSQEVLWSDFLFV